jgi:ATP-dependent helicase Lhr and Lhr-like helicase
MPGAFDRLHPSIQKVLWDMKWGSLRDLQVDAIGAWFDGTSDFILMANTASGKTEAAFLPVVSSIAGDEGAGSVRVLYVAPLKALINDQCRRVEDLCGRANISVHRWHGDVSQDKKHNLVESPSGVLLITPESLESLLMRRGPDLRRVFQKLEAVIIDEMHAFLDNERGRQLCCQLARLEKLRKDLPKTRRLGLSATLGSGENGLERAKKWLQGGRASDVLIVESKGARSIELVIKAFVQEAVNPAPSGATEEQEEDLSAGLISVAQHILDNLRGRTNLVFCNRKAQIEILADFLRQLCERNSLPNEFLVHHGSLSKPIREHTEQELHSGRPTTALCSSTLELGINVGDVHSVGQVEPPHSVSALKQRLGRSGRKEGTSSRLWLYVPLLKVKAVDPLPDRLYTPLLQAVSMVDLMLEKWVEPPSFWEEDFSTFIQQTLSLVVERGGVSAQEAYRVLSSSPPFSGVSERTFADLLRDLAAADLIEQAANKDLILGLKGEKLTSHYDFFAAFSAPDEYDVMDGSRHIGSIELMPGYFKVGDHILLAATRWKIIEIDEERQLLIVRRSHEKRPTPWLRGGGHIHSKIRERMRELLLNSPTPKWVNASSAQVLEWARSEARTANLGNTNWVDDGSTLWLFTWTGSRANHTLRLLLLASGFTVIDRGICLGIEGARSQVEATLKKSKAELPKPEELVIESFPDEIPPVGKHGAYLSQILRARAYASAHLDMPGAASCLEKILRLV